MTKQYVERAFTIYDTKQKKVVSRVIIMEIDWQQVADLLGPKAIKNKSGQSKLLGGALKGKMKL